MASRLVASIVEDYEPDLSSLTLTPFDDGRFIVLRDGKKIFDRDRTGKFPKYDTDIKDQLGRS